MANTILNIMYLKNADTIPEIPNIVYAMGEAIGQEKQRK